ncbi:MAG TPA: hypothetical protein VF179_32035 [Thermoanaerobaculia bacterium]|nr:hypothetical protein [Thermoanaerobaculia bacterium]
MRNLWRILVCTCLAILAAGAAGAEDQGLSPDTAAALRAHARDRFLERFERRAVRPIDERIAAEEAKRLASRLDERQLLALAAGGDMDEIAGQIRSTAAPSLGDSTTDLVFVPLAPCRIIDTRVAGGFLQPGVVRDFQVAGIFEFQPQGGTQGGCGIPPGTELPVAPAVVINFISVSPSGPGNLRAWAWGQPVPNASVLNYASVPGLAIANGVVVPIAGTNQVPADLHIQADASGTHVVADVTGYFTRFRTEDIAKGEQSITVVSDNGLQDLSAGLCTVVNSCAITASVEGQVIVRAWAQITLDHGTNVGGDRIAVGVKNLDPEICSNNDQSINATDFEIPDSLPAENGIETTLSHKRIFAQGPGSKTYSINARMITGASAGDAIESSRMICTFIPNGAP